MRARLKLAAYLAHVRRADGSWPSDWAFARLAILRAQQALHQYLTDARLPDELTTKAYDASEELRASTTFATEWPVMQVQVLRVRWSGNCRQNKVLSFGRHERQPPTRQTSAL